MGSLWSDRLGKASPIVARCLMGGIKSELFCVFLSVVEMRVLVVVVKPGSFAMGGSVIRQKVSFIQVFYDEVIMRVYLVIVGHDSEIDNY